MSSPVKCPHALRPELETPPSRMQGLPIDERGYVVPWFVDWIDGNPEFRMMDHAKWVRAIRDKLCWVCGKPLGKFKTFVAGPMCGINRTSGEPPCHLECAEWSARNCPFLSNPEQVRREDELSRSGKCIGGFGLSRNPGVTMLWTTTVFDVFDDGKGGYLICMGEPEHVEWYAHGRAATRSEVEASIDSGLPALVAVAKGEQGGLKYLDESKERFMKWLPNA